VSGFSTRNGVSKESLHIGEWKQVRMGCFAVERWLFICVCSGYEVAQNVYDIAERVTIYGKRPLRLSAVTRYTGDVR
jgi:hypothetical protein